jgi:hypothetical protein
MIADEGAITELAEHIVTRIIDDLTSRRAFDNLWDEIDDGTRGEIRQQWVQLTRKDLRVALTTPVENVKLDQTNGGGQVA